MDIIINRQRQHPSRVQNNLPLLTEQSISDHPYSIIKQYQH